MSANHLSSSRAFSSKPLRRFILATTIAPAVFSTVAMAVDLVIPPDAAINAEATGTRLLSEGLLEGFINQAAGANLDQVTPNPGQRAGVDRPRMGETATVVPGSPDFWSENQTWVYTGQFFDADGFFSFAEQIDDQALLRIDNITVLDAPQGVFNTPIRSASSDLDDRFYGMGPNGDGWHDFEVRFYNGVGGAGPIGDEGWGGGNNATYSNKGFGLNRAGTNLGEINGSFYPIIPTEIIDGTPELFRYFSGFALTDDLIVNASGTLTIQGISPGASIAQEQSLRFENAAPATLTINDAGGVHKTLSIANMTQWATAASGGSAVTLAGTSDFRPGQMTDNGIAVTVTQAGPGTLDLRSGAAHTLNSTTFSAVGGTIAVSATNAALEPVAGAAFTVDNTAGQIRFGGGTTFSNAITATASGTILHSAATTDTLSGAINTTAAPLNFNVTAGTLNLAGPVTGAGIVKAGSATLGVTQPLNLTDVTVNAGTVNATAGGALATATVNAGAFRLSGAPATIGTATVTGGLLESTSDLTTTSAVVSGGILRTNAGAAFTDIAVSGGRLEVRGSVTIANQPTVTGGTLALLTPTGSTATVPSPFAVTGGRVEIIPGALGNAGGGGANPVNLTGGTLALGGGSGDPTAPQGLNAHIYDSLPALLAGPTGTYNPDWGPSTLGQADVDFNLFSSRFQTLEAGNVPRVTSTTLAGGTTQIQFPDTAGAPFAVLGAAGPAYSDNIETRFDGVFFAETAGDYGFGTMSDDGSVIFIDGVSVVNNNRYQGQTRRDGTATLTAGYHSIEIGFYERGGGAGVTAFYTPPGGVDGIIPNSILFQRFGAAIYDNPITAGGGAIDVISFAANVTSLTVPDGIALPVTGGKLSIATLNLTGASSAFDIANETTVLAVNDGGAAVSIVKTGAGDLIFDDPAAPQLQNAASTIDIRAGGIGVVLGGANQGTGMAQLLFNGGGLVLSSKDGLDKNFVAPNFGDGGVLRARQIGSGMAGTPAAPIAINITNGLTVNAPNTLLLSTADDYVLNIGGAATGGGNVSVSRGVINATSDTAFQGFGLATAVQGGGVDTAVVNLKSNAPVLRSLDSQGTGVSSLVVGDGAAPATLTLTGSAATEVTRFNGTIAENGQPVSVVSSGAGTQTLAASNTFTGGLTVSSGTVELGASGAAGTGAITLSGGTLQFSDYGLALNVYSSNPNPEAYSGILNTIAGVTSHYAGLPVLDIATTTAANGNTAINYQGGGGAPFAIHGSTLVDDIEALLTGQFLAETSGVYRFEATSDDGSSIFIDGSLLVNNNGLHGNVTVGADITLTAGYHDITMFFNERGGGANFFVNYTTPGGTLQFLNNGPVGNPTLRNVDTVATNAVIVTADSALDLRGGNVALGALTQTSGTTLTATAGRATFPNVLMNGGGIYNYAGAGSIVASQITDGGGAVTINRSGGGNLVLSTPAAPQLQNAASTINVSGGSLVVAVTGAAGTGNPLGNAVINLNGGGIGLSTSDAFTGPTFGGALNLAGDGIVSAGNFGGGAVSGTAALPITATVTRAPAIPAGRTLTVNSRDGYNLVLAAGASGAGSLTASGGMVESDGPIALTGAGQLSVTGGTLTTLPAGGPAPITADRVNLSGGGTLNAFDAITATNGASISEKARLILNGLGYTGGGIAIDEGTLQASTGANDLSGSPITISPIVATPAADVLQGDLYLRTGLTIANYNAQDVTADATINLTAPINIPQTPMADGQFTTLFGGSGPGGANFTAAFSGQYTANAAGIHQFGISNNDDGAVLYLDLNRNGIFEDQGSAGSELLAAVGCCNNAGLPTDVNLVAGETYAFLVAVEDTGGQSGLFANFAQPGGVLAPVEPGAAAQAGIWSVNATTGGGLLQVGDSVFGGAGTSMTVGSVTNGRVAVAMGGSLTATRLIANAGIVLEGGFAPPTALTLTGPGDSNTASLTAGGGFSANVSTVNLAAGVTLEAGNLAIAAGLTKLGPGTLNALDQSIGANGLLIVSGGIVNLRGSGGASRANVPPSPFTPQAQVDAGGTLNVAGSLTGQVNLNGGTLTGTGSIGNLQGQSANGTVAPGENGTGILSTAGVILDNTITVQIELMDPANLDRLNVTGSIALNNATLTLAPLWATPPAEGSLFFIVVNDDIDAVTGAFLGLPDGATFTIGTGAAATPGFISYFGDFATNSFTGGNDIVIAVPEPGAMASLAGGIGMLLGLRRMRRRRG